MKPTTDLTRRAFIKLGATAAAAGLADCSGPTARTAQPAGSKAGPAAVSGADAFNYILGTQSTGATYQFTDQTLMVETAQAILDLGPNVLKITMGRDYQRMVLKPGLAGRGNLDTAATPVVSAAPVTAICIRKVRRVGMARWL